jgi:hypothetical protein
MENTRTLHELEDSIRKETPCISRKELCRVSEIFSEVAGPV